MILDTNALSALLAGDPALGELLAGTDRHSLPVIVIGEYLYGVRRSRHGRRLTALLHRLVRESTVLRIDLQTAEVYAHLREGLRTSGRPIPENDLWIAALAYQHDQPVVSRDSHFDHVEDVERLTW